MTIAIVTLDAFNELDAFISTEADAVLIGSGSKTRELVNDPGLLGRIQLDPTRQLIGAQCSGTLVLAKLGLLGDRPACTDVTTKPWVVGVGVRHVKEGVPVLSQLKRNDADPCIARRALDRPGSYPDPRLCWRARTRQAGTWDLRLRSLSRFLSRPNDTSRAERFVETKLRQFDIGGAREEFYKRFHFNRIAREARLAFGLHSRY